MNVPKLRFKEFNEEWQKINLKNVFEYFSTNSLSRDQLSDSGMIKNIHYGDIHRKYSSIVNVENDVETYIKDINYNNKYELCKDADLVFADASEDYDGIGKVIELDNVKCNTVSGLHTILVRDKENIFAPMFKGYYFNSPTIHNQIRILANGFKVYGISKDSINKLNINIPTKKEQYKIANTLFLLDKKIELQTKKIEDLKLFTKILETQYIFNNHNEYSKKRIDEIFSIKAGGDIEKSNVSSVKTTSFCYPIYSNNLEMNGLFGYSNIYKIEEDSITVTGRGDIGKAIKRNGKYYPIVRLLVLIPKINVNLIYMQEAINNLKLIQESTGVPQLTAPQISKYKILYPTIDIQNRYGKILDLLQRKIEYEIIKRKKIKELKKGLMQNMFV